MKTMTIPSANGAVPILIEKIIDDIMNGENDSLEFKEVVRRIKGIARL